MVSSQFGQRRCRICIAKKNPGKTISAWPRLAAEDLGGADRTVTGPAQHRAIQGTGECCPNSLAGARFVLGLSRGVCAACQAGTVHILAVFSDSGAGVPDVRPRGGGYPKLVIAAGSDFSPKRPARATSSTNSTPPPIPNEGSARSAPLESSAPVIGAARSSCQADRRRFRHHLGSGEAGHITG